MFSIAVIGKKRESKLVLETIDSKNVILYLNEYTDTALKFTYSVKNEEGIEILKITKDQFTLCLNVSGLFGNLKVRRIKFDIREFNITKDGALIGRVVEINTVKRRPLRLEVYDEYFTSNLYRSLYTEVLWRILIKGETTLFCLSFLI